MYVARGTHHSATGAEFVQHLVGVAAAMLCVPNSLDRGHQLQDLTSVVMELSGTQGASQRLQEQRYSYSIFVPKKLHGE